jgi:VCBS repeat-containing protein
MEFVGRGTAQDAGQNHAAGDSVHTVKPNGASGAPAQLAENGADAQVMAAAAALAAAPAQVQLPEAGHVTRVSPNADGTVTLPADANLQTIHAEGRDLVVDLPDGSKIIIVDGAVDVPKIVVGDVEVPALNLAALLVGNEPQPAAGGATSSGGNFEVPPGDIGPGFGIGDLLPPTELVFPAPEIPPLIPGIVNKEPTVTITPTGGVSAIDAVQSVNEAGLPARGTEPPGSNSASNSETGTGVITFDPGDGPAVVTINGVAVTAVGQVIEGADGNLTITSISATEIGYSYTLADNTSGDATHDDFAIVVTDRDGDTAAGTLTVNIIDDVPTAHPDTNTVAEGGALTVGAATGVLTNDVPGADDFAVGGGVVGVRAAGGDTSSAVTTGVNTQITGLYGTLTLQANGSYTYHSNPNAVPPAGANDVFVYTIRDGDGDQSTTTLTIHINDAGLAATNDDVIVDEAALPIGSNPASNAETVAGTLADNTSGGTGPYTFAVVGSNVGAHGTLTLNANGTYSYTLTSPFDTSPDANNGTNTENNADTFTYQATDALGNTITSTITVDIIDDVPTAHADSNSVAEGALLSVAAAGVLTNDVAGADGFAAGGGVVGARAAGGDTTTAVTTGVNTQIAGLYGTLTLQANGSYTYQSNPNSVPPAGADDVFVYTVRDGDGDQSTTTLTIHIGDAGLLATNEDVIVDEAALPIGSNPGSNAETVAGTLVDNTSGGTGPYTYALQGSNVGAHGTLTLNANGTYSYTLTSPYDTSPDADNGTNVENNRDTFTYVVTDSHGNTTTNTFTVDIIDDVPNVTVAQAAPLLVVDETNLAGNATASFANTFTEVFGADGPAASGSVTYALNAVAGPSGLVDTLTGLSVILSVNGSGVVEGRTNGGGNLLVFTVSVDANGNVTLDQSRAVVHADPTNPDDTVSLAANLVTLTETIKDGDGDTDSAAVQIGSNLVFHDDAPHATADTNAVVEGALLTVAASGVLTNDVPGADGYAAAGGVTGVRAAGGDTSTAVTTGVNTQIVGLYGTLTLQANGSYTYQSNPNSIPEGGSADDVFVYSIKDGDGDLSTTTLTIHIGPTNLLATNDDVTVNEAALPIGSNPASNAETVAGTLADNTSGGTGPYTYAVVGSNVGAYGTLTLNANGTYSYTLQTPYDTNPDANNGTNTENNRDTFTYQVTDNLGNTTTSTITVDIIDDVPTAHADNNSVAEGALLSVAAAGVLTNDVAGADGFAAGGGVVGARAAGGDTTTAVTTGVNTQIAGLYGTLTLQANGSYTYQSNPNSVPPAGANDVFVYSIKDGDGDLSTTTLTIHINDSGLVTTNDDILVDEAALPIGTNPSSTAETAAGTLADNTSGGTGPYTYTVVGSNVGSHGTLTLQSDGTYSYTLTSPFDTDPPVNNGTQIENNKDTFTYQVKDSLGNITTSTITVDIKDDAPLLKQADVGTPNMVVDETNLAQNATGNFAPVFTEVFGADGPAPSDSIQWAMAVTAGPSGLTDTLTGQAVILSLNGSGVVEGRTSVSNELVFTVGVDANGVVTLDQIRAVVHGDPTQPDETVNLASGLVFVGEAITDGDGDVAAAAKDIGPNLIFHDDAPDANADSNFVNEGALLTVPVTGVLANDSSGNDGYHATGAVTGVRAAGGDTTTAVTTGVNTQIAGLYGTLTLQANGSYTYQSNPNSVPQAGADDVFVYTIKDGDGDLSTTTLTIHVNDSTVLSTADTVTVDEAALAIGSNPGSNAETVAGTVADNVSLGTPPYTFALVGSNVGAHGTITFNANGTYSYTLTSPVDGPTADNGTNTITAGDSFTYKVTDSLGNTSQNTINIDIIDDVPTAHADTDSVTEDGPLTADGNVMTGSGGVDVNITDGNKDTQGADGAVVTGVVAGVAGSASGNVGASVAGTYGSLTIGAGGAYTYTLANAQANVQGLKEGQVVQDKFTYTITDGDGDTSTTTVTIDVTGKNDAPVVTPATTRVSEEGLTAPYVPNPDTTGNTDTTNSKTSSGSVTFTDADIGDTHTFAFTAPVGTFKSGGQTITWAVTNSGHTLDGTINGGTTNILHVTIDDAGTYNVTLNGPVDHANTTEEDNLSIAIGVGVNDGTTTTNSSLTVIVEDDSPTIGTIDNSLTNNNPAHAVSVGNLHFSVGGDAGGDVVSIAYTGPALTVGGAAVLTSLNGTGDKLTGYVDVDKSGTFNGGDTTVFTVDASPTGGSGPGAGTYTFDLVTALDGVLTKSTIGGSNAFGSGPAGGQDLVLADKVTVVANISGWYTTDVAGFNETNWLATKGVNNYYTDGLTSHNVNGSTVGWGTDNNVFSTGEFMRYDFSPSPADDFDGGAGKNGTNYDPSLSKLGANKIGFADFEFPSFKSTDHVAYVVHMEDGTTQTGVLTGSALTGTVSFTANAGTFLDWIDFYVEDGSGKTTLIDVGTLSTVVNDALTFDVVLADADGDTTKGSFTVTVDSKAAPVAIDLNGDGLHFLSTAAGVTFDLLNDGNPVNTAWVAPDDGLLALDANGDGKITNGSEIVFATTGTDLEGIKAVYDTNHDGVLSAADADFAKFGVWQDANSNGVTDPGEFKTLTELGITSINLTSNGVSYTTADGDVQVAGTTTFTRADGSTGAVGDVAFAYNDAGATVTDGAALSVSRLARAAEDVQRALSSSASSYAGALVASTLIAASAAGFAAAEPLHLSDLSFSAPVSVTPTFEASVSNFASTSDFSSAFVSSNVSLPSSTPASVSSLSSGFDTSALSHGLLAEATPAFDSLSSSSSFSLLNAENVSGGGSVTVTTNLPNLFSGAGGIPALPAPAAFEPVDSVKPPVVTAGTQAVVSQILADALHGGEAATGPTLLTLIEQFTGDSSGSGKLGALLVGGGLESGGAFSAASLGHNFGGMGFGHDFAAMVHDSLAAAGQG